MPNPVLARALAEQHANRAATEDTPPPVDQPTEVNDPAPEPESDPEPAPTASQKNRRGRQAATTEEN
ncbi:hypothetical protein [Nocardioides sp.]|uniref:hypothetical protein n=1 Tax=Nocardioides sp. TaxID=35761 RepID=UPI00263371BF|nr:hypothetical protein [Nocardioides sp.]